MMALMVAGVVALLAGLAAVLFGIPVKEFSFGNTLILSGCIGACTGLILLGLSAVLGELKQIARRLAGDSRSTAADVRVRAALPQGTGAASAAGEGGFLFSRDQSAAEAARAASDDVPSMSPPLWQEETSLRTRSEVPPEPQPAEAAPARPKRNLLFQSSMRRDRERAARGADPGTSELGLPQEPEADEAPPGLDHAWPKMERARGSEIPPSRRSSRAATVEPTAVPVERNSLQPRRTEDHSAVTVLKSGVVDGMAYSLYSDGSIEAQMPEGLMRFASLEELTAHIERRS